MLGLLVKDFKLLKNQKSFFLILIGFSLFFLYMNNDTSFVVGYVTFLSCLFVVSSISYDEFNNCSAFLLTLPVTRKEYTLEKYGFGILIGTVAWILATAITIVYSYFYVTDFQLMEWLGTCAIMLFVAFVFMSVIIPVQLKFGQTKGNIAMIICMAGIAAVGFVATKIAELMGVDIIGMMNSLSSIGTAGIVTIIMVIVGICLVISYSISLQIVKKKEF